MNSQTYLDRATLISQLKFACNNNTLLTYKHDPNNTFISEEFRSVLTQQASASLEELINSEKYHLDAYYNTKHQKYSYMLTPFDSGSYSIVGLGIPSGSSRYSGSFDSYLVVSGSSDGWHIYSQNLDVIKAQIHKGRL